MPTRKIDRFTVHYTNADELRLLKREIFTDHCYYFESKNPQPKIIDVGAHIGLSTLYFKKLFPSSSIIAIEPHPTAVTLLEQNIWENGLTDVRVCAAATSPFAQPITLHEDTDKTWLSTTSMHERAWNAEMPTTPLSHSLESIDLASLLKEPVDLLKMDIEGMEQAVLSQLPTTTLQNIGQAVIEFHPTAGQNIEQFVELLKQANFSITISKQGKAITPQKASGLSMIHATNRHLFNQS
ncbi:MAG: FkbM family methyltransferase [Patescibacteria group bacterium]